MNVVSHFLTALCDCDKNATHVSHFHQRVMEVLERVWQAIELSATERYNSQVDLEKLPQLPLLKEEDCG